MADSRQPACHCSRRRPRRLAAVVAGLGLLGGAGRGGAEEPTPEVPAAAAEAAPSSSAPPFIAGAVERAATVEFAAPLEADPGHPSPATGPADDEPALDDLEADPAPPPAADDQLRPVLPALSLLVAEPVRGVASSGFGWRDDPIRHRRRFHRGNDFRAPHGTPVHAAAAGEVVFVGRRGGYGRLIDVRHADGVLTRYAHLSHIDVDRGQRVGTDQVIGRVGSTGRATGPHLHFEVRLLDRAVDPMVAVRVGELVRTADPGVWRLAALALRPEVQEAAVSQLDPPGSHRRPHHKAPRPPKKRRPPVS